MPKHSPITLEIRSHLRQLLLDGLVLHWVTVIIVDVVVEALPQQLAVMPRELPTTPPLTTSPFAWDHQCRRTIAQRLVVSC